MIVRKMITIDLEYRISLRNNVVINYADENGERLFIR